MSQQLTEVYEKIKSRHPDFEIFFCSSDRSESSFDEYLSTMPWASFPYGSAKIDELIQAYDVAG
jgi:nucleoredoxin